MNAPWTEEEIAAFVDGAVEDFETEERLRRAIETDPDAAAFAARVAATNAALQAAHSAPLEVATPPRLLRALSELGATLEAKAQATERLAPPHAAGRIRAPRPRRTGRGVDAAPRATVALAMAASLAIAVGIGWWSHQAFTPGATSVAGLGDAPVGGALHVALETTPTGVRGPDQIRPVFTFRDGRGRYCREFEAAAATSGETEIGLACRTAAGRWHVEIAGLVAAETGNDGAAFSLSSGPTRRAMEALLDEIEAGPALPAVEEQRLIESGWRR